VSNFLSNGGSSPAGLSFGANPLDFQPTERERQYREWLLADVLGTHGYKELAAWVNSRILIDGFELPIGQVSGFLGFVFKPAATILTFEATTSTTYVDLATAGPSLTGLADGQYAIFFGFNGSSTTSAIMSISVNGAAASDDDSCSVTTTSSTMRMVLATLSADGNNTVTTKYRSGSGTSQSFGRRWLSLVKYQNA
jgi:hypothetical protein